MPGKRQNRAPNRTATRKPEREARTIPAASGSWRTDRQFRPGSLNVDARALSAVLADATPATLVPVGLPYVWANASSGLPANMCLDACHVLRHGYAQLGIRATLCAVTMVAEDARGRCTRYGSAEPHFDGRGNFHGHCVLYQPESGHYVDPTVQQFPELAHTQGPVVGKSHQGLTFSGVLPPAGQDLKPNSTFVLIRGDVTLTYTTVDAAHAPVVTQGPVVVNAQREFRRIGINLATAALDYFRMPSLIHKAMQVPHPRVSALLQAIGQASIHYDDADNASFELPGPGGPALLRLDAIPLPENCPPALL
jgi:hypothetical protein